MYRQKDFPRQIVVGDGIWDVKFVRRIHETPKEMYMGLCDPAERTIFIAQRLKPMERVITFFHEFLHAVEEEFQIELGHPIINKLEKPLALFFLENFFGMESGGQRRRSRTAAAAAASLGSAAARTGRLDGRRGTIKSKTERTRCESRPARSAKRSA